MEGGRKAPSKDGFMHRKVAKKYMSRLLCDYIQKTVAEVRINYSKLEHLTERAISLVEKSSHKEHIYKEAGDMIFLYQAALEEMQDQLAVLSYITEKLGLTSAADDLNPAMRKELDKALKGNKLAEEVAAKYLNEYTDIEELQGLPTFIDEKPPSEQGDEGLDDEVTEPAPTDWSDFSVDLTRPNVTDDMVP